MTKSWVVSDKPNSYNISGIIFSCSTIRLPHAQPFPLNCKSTGASHHRITGYLLFCSDQNFFYLRGGNWGLIPTFSPRRIRRSAPSGQGVGPRGICGEGRAHPTRGRSGDGRGGGRPGRGFQSCLSAALSIRNSWRGAHRQFSAAGMFPAPSPLLGSRSYRFWACCFFIIEWWNETFSFFTAFVDFFLPALSFQDYHRKYSIQHESPRGLLARGFNIYYSVFHLFSFPLPLDPSSYILPIPMATPKHLYSIFISISDHIFDFFSEARSLNELSTGNWIVLPASECSLILSPNYICRALTCWILGPPDFK